MTFDHDAIVIGSGFGGAVAACRLAERGYNVLILERGRRWKSPKDASGAGTPYPRKPTDPWLYDANAPEWFSGWLDLRLFRHMSVAQGAGFGGGSLIYANVSCEAPPWTFDRGWPPEITYDVLKPYYERVGAMLDVQTVPPAQWNPRMRLMQEAAGKIGHGDRFRPLPLAVSFDPDLELDGTKPLEYAQAKTFTNKHGAQQAYCIHDGECDIGCSVYAKNTLDKNYLYLAEKKHGAQVRTEHLVTDIVPDRGGYRVVYDKIEVEAHRRVRGSSTTRLVVIAAGSLNSTELLLRCRRGSLPKLSGFLGRDWSSNGDFLTPAIQHGREIKPSFGPTIGSTIDFLDRKVSPESFWIEDGGVPPLAAAFLQRQSMAKTTGMRAKLLLTALRDMLRGNDPLDRIMPWFAQGVDAANGQLELRRPWWFFGRRRLTLDWEIEKSQKVMNAIVDTHRKLAHATGGEPLVSPAWTVCRDLITPHPLGGCNMGTSPQDGVVDHAGRVFGYPGLYVMDGAVIPEALGVNPSRTIAALAERSVELLIASQVPSAERNAAAAPAPVGG